MITSYKEVIEFGLDPITTLNTMVSASSTFSGTAKETIETFLVNNFLLNPEFLKIVETRVGQEMPSNTPQPQYKEYADSPILN